MAQRVCPWWLGYFLACPLRRLTQDPVKILSPYVREGMAVLEPGPGMGFFTTELARLVGPTGHVVAVDVQPKMVSGLKRRIAKAGLLARVDPRIASSDSLGVTDMAGSVDFTLAFALVHEMPSAERFFVEVAAASKSGSRMLLVEPAGHVDSAAFDTELKLAAQAGFKLIGRPVIRHSHAALLQIP